MVKELIIVDSYVFIQAFRKNRWAKNDLKEIEKYQQLAAANLPPAG